MGVVTNRTIEHEIEKLLWKVNGSSSAHLTIHLTDQKIFIARFWMVDNGDDIYVLFTYHM